MMWIGGQNVGDAVSDINKQTLVEDRVESRTG
jgi:hypothetical protein